MTEFQRICLVHYHEIGLKGHNRSTFEMRLLKNLEALLISTWSPSIESPVACACFCARAPIGRLRSAAPTSSARCPALPAYPPATSERDLAQMEQAALAAMADVDDFTSFKVQARRNHTDFEVGSMDMNRIIGAALCEAHPENRFR